MTTLYKYRPYTVRSLEILIDRAIYFAAPHQLNDPYDCQLVIRDAVSGAVEQARREGNAALERHLAGATVLEEIYAKLQADIQATGILALAKSPTCVLMWSHYAENHTGFALGFQFSEKFTTHRNTEQIIGAADAYYTDANPFSAFLADFLPRATVADWNEFWTTMLEIGLRAKGAAWGYEHEVRILRKTPGTVSYDPSELREVVFGLNMPDAQRMTVRKLLSTPDWRHVQYRRIVRTDGFAVDVVPAP